MILRDQKRIVSIAEFNWREKTFLWGWWKLEFQRRRGACGVGGKFENSIIAESVARASRQCLTLDNASPTDSARSNIRFSPCRWLCIFHTRSLSPRNLFHRCGILHDPLFSIRRRRPPPPLAPRICKSRVRLSYRYARTCHIQLILSASSAPLREKSFHPRLFNFGYKLGAKHQRRGIFHASFSIIIVARKSYFSSFIEEQIWKILLLNTSFSHSLEYS